MSVEKLVEAFEKAVMSHREIHGISPRYQAFLKMTAAKAALLAHVEGIGWERNNYLLHSKELETANVQLRAENEKLRQEIEWLRDREAM